MLSTGGGQGVVERAPANWVTGVDSVPMYTGPIAKKQRRDAAKRKIPTHKCLRFEALHWENGLQRETMVDDGVEDEELSSITDLDVQGVSMR